MDRIDVPLITLILAVLPVSGQGRAEDLTQSEPGDPEQKAIRFLQRELAGWYEQNRCYSCHNNGDAVRALCAAKRLGYTIDLKHVRQTANWLRRPERWNENRGDPRFSDKRLARLQFAYALCAVSKSDLYGINDGELKAVADLVHLLQNDDGAWSFTQDGILGSPITYGSCLATAVSLDILTTSDPVAYREAIRRGEQFMLAQEPFAAVDLAGVHLGIQRIKDDTARSLRKTCIERIKSAQNRSGGWGPFRGHPTEVFDTAIVVCALACSPTNSEIRAIIDAGRRYLIDEQLADGSWFETTRPSGATSYAHRVSTSAWATMALLQSKSYEMKSPSVAKEPAEK